MRNCANSSANQMLAKRKPIMSWSLSISYASGSWLVSTLSYPRLLEIYSFILDVLCDFCLGLDFTTLNS